MVKINGTDVDAAGTLLAGYLEARGYTLTRIAVERNGEIVPKSRYGEILMEDGDRIEVVSFVGGG